MEIEELPSTDRVIKEFKHLFFGIGCLPGEYDIKVDPDDVLKLHPPR